MRERTTLDKTLSAFLGFERAFDDALTLIELGEAEKDEPTIAEGEAALVKLAGEARQREVEALLSGEADGMDTFLEVHAGAGGTESQDWANMLLRMYTRWAERRGLKVTLIDLAEGEEAGIKSATLEIKGRERLRLAENRSRACIASCASRLTTSTRGGTRRSRL